MDEARIAELLAPFFEPEDSPGPKSAPLAPSQLKQISIYIDMLLHWNARINLTAVRRPEEIVTRHFGESFFAARRLFPEAAGNHAAHSTNPPHVLDFGSGAGFPGLPIKIWAPFIRLTLIESNQKKATFLREVVRALRLTDVDVSTERVKTVSRRPPSTRAPVAGPGEPPPQPTADVVTLRAVEKFEAALQAAVSLLSPSGRLALLIGDTQVLIAHPQLPGFHWRDPLPIPGSTRRLMLLGTRIVEL